MSSLKSLLLLAILFCIACSNAQRVKEPLSVPETADKAPAARIVRGRQWAEVERSIAPYVQQARKELPRVRAKFRNGLADGDVLFVTVRISDAQKKFEQVYIEVEDWYDSRVLGLLASDVQLVKKYRPGELVNFHEDLILDWMILKPDGTFEGNYVGSYLETQRIEQLN